jgi:putative ABC transport system permease protein
MSSAVERWAATLPEAGIVPLRVAVDETRSQLFEGRVAHPHVDLGVPVDDDTVTFAGIAYVATPELLDYLSIDPATIAPETVVLTAEPGDVYLTGDISDTEYRRDPVSAVQRIAISPYASLPHALITDHAIETAGWTVAPAGWLIESSRPISDDQLAAAREMAATSGLAIEARDSQTDLSTLRMAATGIGIAVALAILATSVGLIRAETARDVGTLTAVGASSRTRRAVTASTAAALAALAVILGMSSAYAAVYAGYTPATDRLGNIPVANLLVIAIGFPLIAGAAGWLLSRPERPGIVARPAIE